MQYFKSSNVITVPGWSMTAVSVSSDSALSNEGISKPGVYFLVDEGQCFYEAQDMAARLAEIWRQNDPSQLDQQPQQETQPEERQSEWSQQWQEEVNPPVFEPTEEADQTDEQATAVTTEATEAADEKTAICFMSFNNNKKLQGEKILKLLGFLGHVKLHVDFGQVHAEGAERPDGFTVFAGSQIRPSRSEKFVSQYPEAYAKVDWEKKTDDEDDRQGSLDLSLNSISQIGESMGDGVNSVAGGKRDISKGTGTLLSPNDRKLGDEYPDEVVLTLYKVTGNKGWDGKKLWIPNIKLPEKYVYYSGEEEIHDEL